MNQKRDEHYQAVSRKLWSVLAVVALIVVSGIVLFSVSREKALAGEAYSVVQSQCPGEVLARPVLSISGDQGLPAGSISHSHRGENILVYGPGVKGKSLVFGKVFGLDKVQFDSATSNRVLSEKFSIEGWILPESNDNTIKSKNLVFNYYNTGSDLDLGYHLYLDAENHAAFSITSDSGEGIKSNDVISDLALPLGKWSHIAVVREGSQIKLYLNGDAPKSMAVENIDLGNTQSTRDFYLDFWNDFIGSIDELNFYNEVLTEPEIQVLAQACNPQPGCDENGLAMRLSGELNTIDVKGNSHATRVDQLDNAQEQQANRYGEGVMGKAFRFAGGRADGNVGVDLRPTAENRGYFQYLQIPDGDDALDPQQDGFSLEVWYEEGKEDYFADIVNDAPDWLDRNYEILNRGMLAYKRKDLVWSQSLYGLKFVKYHLDNNPIATKCQVAFYLKTDANVGEYDYTIAEAEASADLCSSLNREGDQGWHQAVGVYDGGRIYLYVDGVLRASTNTQGIVAPDVNNAPFIVGADNPKIFNNMYSGEYFGGLIDEVSFYNNILSSSEVKRMYLAGKRGKCQLADCTNSANCNKPDCLDLGTVKLGESSDYEVTLPCPNSAVNLRT